MVLIAVKNVQIMYDNDIGHSTCWLSQKQIIFI